jgi:hypothetical protein
MEARFCAPVQTGPGDHPATYTMGTGFFPWVSGRRGIDHPPYLAPRLKKEQSYTSAPPLGLRGCSRVNFSFNWQNTTKAFVILYYGLHIGFQRQMDMVPSENERTPYDKRVVAAWYERNQDFLVLTLRLNVLLNTKVPLNKHPVCLKLKHKNINLGTK